MDNWFTSTFSGNVEGRTGTRFSLLVALIICCPALLFAQLPTGYGWYPLPNTQMINSCPANNPQGACGNAACTTYQEFSYHDSCNYIILPWSGGAGDDVNQRLYVFGGGHTDYGGNQLMALDLRGTPSWEIFYAPDKVAYPTDQQGLVPNWESYNPYVESGDTQHYPASGGSPSSRHTYFGLAFAPAQNSLYAFSGAVYHLGDNSPEAWAISASTRTWQLLAPYGNGYMGAVALNPNTGHFVGYDGQYNIYDYDPVAHTRTTLSTSIPASVGQNWAAAVDPIDNLFIFITGDQYPPEYQYNNGPASKGYIRGYNLSTRASIIWDDPSCNGAPVYQAMGLEWDSALGLMVGYPSFGNQIILLNSQPNAVVTNYGTVPSHKCLQVTIGSTKGTDYPPDSTNPSNYTGGFGRFRYFPSLDIFVNVNDASNNAWILRLNDVSSPSFTVSATPASLSVVQGTQGSSTITTAISGGFNSAISLTASGAPSGTTVSFNPSTIPAPGSGNSTMTMTVGSSTPVGTYPITVTASGGSIRQTTTVSLTVTANQPSLTVSASPASLTTVQGTQATSTVTTAIGGGFNSAVSLTASGAPSGTTVSFNPSTIPAPGAGSSAMTITVGASTPTGTYSITVKATGGGLAPTTIVTLTVTAGSSGWQQGFDFRATAGFVTDPANTTHVLATTAYPSTVGGVTFGWVNTGLIQSRDRSTTVDPRLAGINYVRNGSPGTFYVNLPSAGTYNVSLALGDEGYTQCWTLCQVQFLDGSTVLGTVTGNPLIANFDDAKGNNWTAAAWPGSNVALPVTLSGTRLTVIVGTNNPSSDVTPIAYLGLSQGNGGGSPSFTVSATPASLSVVQGTQGSSTITTAISGGFNSAISLTATGAPSGTTVSFNPSTIPAPGSGNSTMTMTVGSSTPVGTYPITVTASGGGIRQTTTVSLTVTANQPSLTVSASPASLTIVQGTQATSTITTAIGGGFNSAVSLTASGAPSGTTVSFNPSTIPAPGSGSSAMTVTVGASTPTGTYSITVKATGGGLAPTTTVSLTVTSSGGGGGTGNGITVSDLTGSGQTNRFISVGRFFKDGDIPNFAQAVVGGVPILTQCDVKNRWPDGSLKFAIISFVLPSVSTAGTAVSFQNQGTGNNTGFLQQGDMLNTPYDFEAAMQLTGTVSPSISARAMLQAGLYRYWLQGPIVTAVIIEDRNARSADVNTDGGTGDPLHPIFEAWFYPQGSKVQVGFTLENAWASSTSTQSARNQTFALTLQTGYNSPTTRLSQPSFTQWGFTRWHRAFWVDSDPPPVQYNWNPQYLLTTGAYPNWDLTYMPPASSIAAEYATYTSLQTQFPARFTLPGFDDPNNGGVVNYNEAIDAGGESTHGDWIGMTTSWDTIYLLTGDPNLQKMATDNADFAARFPMWFREADHNAGSGHYFDEPGNGSIDPYGHVVSVNARQQVTLYLGNWNGNSSFQGCGGTEGEDTVYTTSAPSHGGWPAMGSSHLPDFGYVPYSLTGQYYYLEQEQLEAGYLISGLEGCYNLSLGNMGWRQGYLGLKTNLVRDDAWTLRTLAYGAFISPDGTPEQAYLQDKLMNNLAMQQGAHGLAMTVPVTTASSAAYSFGQNVLVQSQAANPSPLGAWQIDSASQSYAQNGSENNVNPNTLSNAGAPWQEAFLAASFGMIRQFGQADTTSLLGFMAIRPVNEVLNPVLNHYLVGQYVYPSTLITGGLGPQGWIADWPTLQNNYLVLPTGWECGTSDSGRSAMQLGILSYMTHNTVNGYSGQSAWSWLKSNFSCQSSIYPNDPRWSMIPLQ